MSIRLKKTLVCTLIIIGVIALIGEPTAESDSLWLKQFAVSKAISAIALYIAYRIGVKWGMWNEYKTTNNQ